MTTSIKQVLNKLPADRQKKIRQQADRYLEEYKTLQDLRKQLGLTQTDIADRQGIKQVNISNLERRSDMLLSTLKSYVEAMGCELEIRIKTPDKKRVIVENLPNVK